MAAVPLDSTALAELLETPSIDLHALDTAAFGSWLAARVVEQRNNAAFQQKCAIRDLVARHERELSERRDALDAARVEFDACPQRPEIERLCRRTLKLRKAVSGLAEAVQERRADARKLARHTDELRTEEQALAEQIAACAEKRRLDEAEAALAAFRDAIGLTAEVLRLHALQRQRGRRSDASGKSFEHSAEAAVRACVLPQVHPADECEVVGRSPVVLRNVTLGAAGVEIDFLIVIDRGEHEPVDVLAMVEAKRNINDLVGGFAARQTDLTWLTGDAERYDPSRYRTHRFPTGHFDRPTWHEQDGRRFALDRSSFARFVRDAETERFLSRLYFVTRPRPLLGVTSLELARILHWAATDPAFRADDATSLRRFHRHVLSRVDRFQTRDVLEFFARRAMAAQIILCDGEAEADAVTHRRYSAS